MGSFQKDYILRTSHLIRGVAVCCLQPETEVGGTLAHDRPGPLCASDQTGVVLFVLVLFATETASVDLHKRSE